MYELSWALVQVILLTSRKQDPSEIVAIHLFHGGTLRGKQQKMNQEILAATVTNSGHLEVLHLWQLFLAFLLIIGVGVLSQDLHFAYIQHGLHSRASIPRTQASQQCSPAPATFAISCFLRHQCANNRNCFPRARQHPFVATSICAYAHLRHQHDMIY